jgi:hypothetical protein
MSWHIYGRRDIEAARCRGDGVAIDNLHPAVRDRRRLVPNRSRQRQRTQQRLRRFLSQSISPQFHAVVRLRLVARRLLYFQEVQQNADTFSLINRWCICGLALQVTPRLAVLILIQSHQERLYLEVMLEVVLSRRRLGLE